MKDLIERLDERVLRSMIDHATVSFWILDEEERILYVNPAGASLTGYALEELQGRPFSILMDGEPAARHRDWIRDYAARGGPSSILGQVRDFQIRHRSGAMIDIELKAFQLDATENGRKLFGGLISDNRDRKTLESRLRQRADHDALTGCLNREGFFPLAARALRQARTHHHGIGLLLLDLDHFKRVNDEHGHRAGDQVLVRVVAALQSVLREDDLLGRYGGEEFVVLLPDVLPERAEEIAERLRQRIEALEFEFAGCSLTVTISIGCAVLDVNDDSTDHEIDLLIASADRALYRAKRAGRNRVVRGELQRERHSR